ncbi:MAG: protein kinase [Proteobacteria bacterium]|nr:protein kinase [Pseudomonadota bacterium]
MPHLGPFELKQPLEEGGLATVWAAVHTPTRLPVAMKVLDPKTDHRVRARALRDELRAMAVLSHPNIVKVLDHGRVPAGVDALPEGLPWIALEYAAGGHLGQVTEPQPWSVIKAWLGQLLSALGHAHAHGVLHRDVKPSNVLLDAKGRAKLCDFGLASALDPEDGAAQAGGTPRYMAPEQFLDDLVRQGPWTDLYGVGCLAWRLVTGHPPFLDKGYEALCGAHLRRDLPPLRPWTAIPEDLGLWLELLLAKDPRARFATAPDAAYHLLGLGPPVVEAVSDDLSDFLLDDEPSEGVSDVLEVLELPDNDPLGAPLPVPIRPPPPPFPPLPMARRVPAQPRLTAAGLALLPLRPLSVAGRQGEQKALWNLFGEVHEQREPRLVALFGESGSGASRLATWLVEQARESGAGGALRAVHNPLPGTHDGLAGMLRRHFRCGSNRVRNAEKVQRALERSGETNPHQWEALTDWLSLSGRDPAMAERHHLVLDHLERLTSERPYVLVIEDAQWAADALSFCDVLLDSSLPVLVILSVEAAALAERPVGKAHVARLLAHEASARLDVRSLGVNGRSAFAASLPIPDRDVADQLVERAGGMPLFAVHMLRDWVASGALSAGPEGPALTPDAVDSLPSELEELWKTRVDRLLDGRPATDRLALDVAATLGRVVVYREWQLACEQAGAVADTGLVEALIDAGLARRTRRGDPAWSFTHAGLRDVLVERSLNEDRSQALNLACARMLEQRGAAPDRLGRHLSRAEKWDEAVEPLLAGARAAFERGEYAWALALLGEAELGCSMAKVDERLRLELLSIRAALAHRRGRLEDAQRFAHRVLERAEEQQLIAYQVSSRSLLLASSLAAGDRTAAREWAEQAKVLADASEDQGLQATTALGLGDVLLRSGRFAAAVRPLRRAVDLGRASGRPQTALVALLHLADAEKVDRRFDRALERVGRARDLAEQMQSGSALASCDLAEADILRAARRYDEALEAYSQAERRLDAIGEVGAQGARIGIALVSALRGDLDGAKQLLDACLEHATQHGHSSSELYARCALSVWAALQPDPRVYQSILTAALARIEGLDYAEPAYAEVFEVGANAILNAGRPSRAQRMRDAAAEVWERLGRAERSAPLRNLIAPPRR